MCVGILFLPKPLLSIHMLYFTLSLTFLTDLLMIAPFMLRATIAEREFFSWKRFVKYSFKLLYVFLSAAILDYPDPLVNRSRFV